MTKHLGPQDWIVAALRTLANDGVDAVRVERLADTLGVTKGSFYWHFADRGVLLAAVLEAWKGRATADIIAEVEGEGGDARARLKALLTIVLAVDGRLERQVRAWAALDPSAAAAQESVDRLRIGYLEQLFAGLGFGPGEVRIRSQFAYHAMVGRFAMRHVAGNAQAASAEIDSIFAMLMIGAVSCQGPSALPRRDDADDSGR